MTSVREIPVEALEAAVARIEARKLKDGREPPDNGDMEARIKALEDFARDARDRLVRVETKLEDVQRNMATVDGVKAAVSEAKNQIVMWVVGAFLLAQFLPSILKKIGI